MIREDVVYLAGGYNSDWRERIKDACPNVRFIDPKEKERQYEFGAAGYTVWDLHAIKRCDICFVFMEHDNPSGYGLSVELGYAKGLGKTVILVLESGHDKERYLRFLDVAADITFESLEAGISYLQTYMYK